MIRRYLYRTTGTITNHAATTVTTFQLPVLTSKPVWILSFHLARTGGTAANWAPTVGQTAGYTAGDIDTRIQYASAVVGTAINDTYTQPIPCMTDANGRLYMQAAWDAGNDNDAVYEIWFEYPSGS